jgi:hypothetical protein
VFVYGAGAIVDYTLGLVRNGLARLLSIGQPPPGGVPMAMVAAASPIHLTRDCPSCSPATCWPSPRSRSRCRCPRS